MAFYKSKTPDWGNIRIFLTLARLGTLTAAAEKLRLAPSSIARHIEQLEDDLQAILFQRGSQGYIITDAGQAILRHAESAEAAIDDLIRQGSGLSLQVSGTVRIAMPENFASELVIPMLPSFQSDCPELRIEIVTDVRQSNLSRREADIALRLSKPKQGNFLVSRIGQMATCLFASQTYLSAHSFDPAGRGAGHLCVAWDEAFHDLPLSVWQDKVLPLARPVLTATSLRSHLAAARAGLGISTLPAFLAGGLTRLGDTRLSQDIFLITHRDTRRAPNIARAIEFLRSVFHEVRHRLADSGS